MRISIPRVLFRLFLNISSLSLVALMLPRLITALHSTSRVFTVDYAPTEPVAIVFGAGLRRDGTPTTILRDRVQTAAQLYLAGKVNKILMSGSNQNIGYNEPEAMRLYALDLGVPDEDIVLDYAGRRTYDTCYRASAIFGVKSALVVTQAFHLPRALFLCSALGINAYGVEADNFYFFKRSRMIWNIRELFATAGAFFDVYISKPVPILGEPDPIFARK